MNCIIQAWCVSHLLLDNFLLFILKMGTSSKLPCLCSHSAKGADCLFYSFDLAILYIWLTTTGVNLMRLHHCELIQKLWAWQECFPWLVCLCNVLSCLSGLISCPFYLVLPISLFCGGASDADSVLPSGFIFEALLLAANCVCVFIWVLGEDIVKDGGDFISIICNNVMFFHVLRIKNPWLSGCRQAPWCFYRSFLIFSILSWSFDILIQSLTPSSSLDLWEVAAFSSKSRIFF